MFVTYIINTKTQSKFGVIWYKKILNSAHIFKYRKCLVFHRRYFLPKYKADTIWPQQLLFSLGKYAGKQNPDIFR